MTIWTKLTDRTAVLMIGIAVGATIASAFYATEDDEDQTPVARIEAPASGTPQLAKAEPAKACPVIFQPTARLKEALDHGGHADIGVFGDSYGEGIWAGLYNDLRGNPAFTVHNFAKRSTGFTRYKSLNLLDDSRAKLDGQSVDLAVVSFGANDTNDIWEEGHLMPYMSDDWKTFIAKRAREWVEQVRHTGATVVWIGLPRMRKVKFDHQIAEMNAFNAKLMCDLDVPFVDTVPKSVDEKGEYTEYLVPPGQHDAIKARAGDGIHMTMTGYRILIADVTRDIRALKPEPAPEPSPRPDKPQQAMAQ